MTQVKDQDRCEACALHFKLAANPPDIRTFPAWPENACLKLVTQSKNVWVITVFLHDSPKFHRDLFWYETVAWNNEDSGLPLNRVHRHYITKEEAIEGHQELVGLFVEETSGLGGKHDGKL